MADPYQSSSERARPNALRSGAGGESPPAAGAVTFFRGKRVVDLDLRGAPSAMEQLAASWREAGRG